MSESTIPSDTCHIMNHGMYMRSNKLTKFGVFFNRLLLADLEAVGLGGSKIFVGCTRHNVGFLEMCTPWLLKIRFRCFRDQTGKEISGRMWGRLIRWVDFIAAGPHP